MDANDMQFAMEQMRKMSPQQLQAMMQSMPPDVMNQAMAQMKDMKPEDWERAKQRMSSMDPETLSQQATQLQSQMAGRTQYIINASNQLKQDGNQLHSRGAYKEAVEKYERAKSNVESFTSKEAGDLVRACTLNLSSCYLNLKQYAQCIQQCNQVLAGEPDNLKALYRRGQAHMGSGSWLDAAADLERALRLAVASDPSQAQPIRDKLQETKDQIGALRANGKLSPASAASTVAAIAPAPAGVVPADPVVAGMSGAAASCSAAAGIAAAPSSPAPTVSNSSAPLMQDVGALARATEMVRSNPAMLKQAQDIMLGMSDDQLRSMARSMGMEVPVETLRSGLEGMDPDVMAKVAQFQAELPPDLRTPDAARNPDSMKRLADLMAQKPDMAASMGQMLSSLDPGKLQEMSRAAGLPPGVTITPDMAKMAAESFKRMSPQEVQAAMQALNNMPAPPGIAASTGPTSNPDGVASASGRSPAPAATPMSGMPAVDPRVAADRLAAMSPEQLEEMAKVMPGGDRMQITPEMAQMAAEMMKKMTPEDMQRIAASMQAVTGGAAAGASASGASPAAAAAGLSGGFTPEVAQMASEMMKNMTPEDMQRMQEMASKMGMAGPGPSGGQVGSFGGLGANPDAMASMMADPKMIESAVRMMKSMDPEATASMLMSSGVCRGRAQAEAMARQMSSLSDTQLRMMVRTAGAVQNAKVAGERAMAWARRNMLLVGAIIVVLLALLLRWLGWM